ncbi:serine/threonine protein kinase [Sulfurirhabdus autotrophica]|uniref:Serine/threonine protein kinase n=1 Tax=Sulfurirhabdus autotrophica TaxID=1706046 RepID=A0A4R3XXT9_9PROT|nr:serine/threonine-protein kinase [Sulfurirhabdus autotrophica]TCV84116.1 serine/threonine protein kinase [Sulfurirhabdus autotrophica]
MALQPNQSLPDGYQLQNYRISRQLSGGGFSMVYLAYDEHGTPVAIKEYLPNSLALRQEGSIVAATSAENLTTFRYGMKCFFEEGRALAKITHPNVVRVVNFFRANETVYMVMQYERGKTLQEHIQANKNKVKEGFIRRVFAELLNGLREVHTHKVLHLDIKPSNIYIRLDGSPVLLDFGAARQTLTNEKSKLSPMYTPGFAAPEQYKNRELLGPWTDIYSVGASLFACLAGFAPQAADVRVNEDKVASAKILWAGKYSEQLLEIIDSCLQLDYMERPQSVFTLQKALMEKIDDPVVAPKRTLMASIKKTFNKEIF